MSKADLEKELGKGSAGPSTSAVSLRSNPQSTDDDLDDNVPLSRPWYKQRRYQVGAAAGAVALAVAVAVPCALLLGKKGNSAGGASENMGATSVTESYVVAPFGQKGPCTDGDAHKALVINEVYPNKPQDWVELHNTNTGCDVLLDGYQLRDDNITHTPLLFKGTCGRLPAGGYLVVSQGTGDCQFNFGYSDKNDTVFLSKGATLHSKVSWPSKIPDNATYARNGDNSYAITTTTTRGAANVLTAPPPVDFERTYEIADDPSAYTGKFTWETVDDLDIKTWDTPTATWNDMWNQPRILGNGTKTISIDACVRSADYPSDLTAPCGQISVRGASARGALVKSFNVKLSKTAPLGKWRGTRKIILSRSPFDYSKLKHAMGYELLRKVPHMASLNANFVNVKMNGVPQGLYTVIEDYGEDSLDKHGLDKHGFLLKAEEYRFRQYDAGWPETINWLDPQTHEDDDLWYKKIWNVTMRISVNMNEDKSGPAFEEIVTQNFHVENLVTFMATAALFMDHDIIGQNYMLYSPHDARKWALLFWDLDGAFDFCRQEDLFLGSHNHFWCKEVMDMGILTYLRAGTQGRNFLFRQLLMTDGWVERVAERARELAGPNGPLSPERAQGVLRKLAARIKPTVLAPGDLSDGVNLGTPPLWQQEINRLDKFLGNMLNRFETQELGVWRSGKFDTATTYPKWKCPDGVKKSWCV